ncbi:hypothetical protein [Pseudoteredinibacter isoporae]|uniref:hypothetical protein n=1 Tax=Pseudoteredinibacter isoporae TaxID=570281 RepID=UPI00310ACD13
MYSIYYHIPSRLKFRSVGKSPKVESLFEVKLLIDLLRWKRDSIFICDYRRKNKLCIGLCRNKVLFCIEVISAEGVFWKEVEKKEVFDILTKIEEVSESPETFNFIGDSI